MPTYTNRASFSSRPNFKLDITAVETSGTVVVTAEAVRTGSETTTPFANTGGGATRTYSFSPTSSVSSPTSGSAEWVFDFRPAGSSSSTNPYPQDVWGSGITRTLSASTNVTVTASMSLLGSASVSVNVPFSPSPVISGNFANGTVGVGYSSSITATNSPTSWSTSGTLPPGLSGSGSGSTFTISGTPSAAGTYTFNVTATNSGGSDTVSRSITINNAAPVISGDFGSGTVGVGYSSSISASNSPTSWSVGSGLPPGLSASSSGSTLTVSGTPTSAGTYSFSVTASNEGGSDTQSKSISIVAPPNPSWSSTGAFGSGKVNQGYFEQRTASNTTSISNASTTAPGLSASGSGNTLTLQGTPTLSGTFAVSATANGASGTTPATLSTTVTIAPLVPPTWSDTSLSSDFRVGVSYATTSSGNNSVSATNATSFFVESGSLPAGISGSTSGSTYTLVGTPTTRSPYSFTLRANNTDGNATPNQAFSGNVTHPPFWTDETLAAFSQGRSYSDAVVVSTSTAVTWSITSGSIPAGVTSITSGTNTNTFTLAGTPTGSGAYSFTIQASNGDGTLTKTFSGNILLVPNWTDNVLGSFVDNVEYSDSVIATNSPTYSVTAGTLPAGITLNSSTGLVSGTPTGGVGTAYSFTITATNASGTVSQAFSGTIQPDLGGGIKLFDGTTWDNKEIYAYDGTTWVLGRLYVYSGTAWIKSVY